MVVGVAHAGIARFADHVVRVVAELGGVGRDFAAAHGTAVDVERHGVGLAVHGRGQGLELVHRQVLRGGEERLAVAVRLRGDGRVEHGVRRSRPRALGGLSGAAERPQVGPLVAGAVVLVVPDDRGDRGGFMALEDVVWELDVISAVHLQGPVLEDAGGLAVRVGDDGLAERRVLHGVGHGRGAGGFGGEVIADDGSGASCAIAVAGPSPTMPNSMAAVRAAAGFPRRGRRMRRPMLPAGDRIGQMRAVAGPIAGHLVARHVLQTRGHVQLRRARGEHARGTPDSHGPSAPPARRNRDTRTTTVSTAACDTRPCAPRTRRDRDADTPPGTLPRPGREPTLRDLAIAQGRQQGGIHRTLPDDPGGTRHITLATMRGTCRPRLAHPLQQHRHHLFPTHGHHRPPFNERTPPWAVH